MGRRNINSRKESTQSRKDFKRSEDNRNQILDVIIACEDSVSAPTYFREIMEKLKEDREITPTSLVIANHQHTDPEGVLKDLISYNGYKYFTHKWIVIDRDKENLQNGHKQENFNNALKKAKRLKVEVAYSNDAFEFWYLLHFNYRDTAILRDELTEQVIKKLKNLDANNFSSLDKKSIKTEEYTKLIFNSLLSKQKTAINNAKKLLESYGNEHKPEKDNPSTTIYKLVEILNTPKET